MFLPPLWNGSIAPSVHIYPHFKRADPSDWFGHWIVEYTRGQVRLGKLFLRVHLKELSELMIDQTEFNLISYTFCICSSAACSLQRTESITEKTCFVLEMSPCKEYLWSIRHIDLSLCFSLMRVSNSCLLFTMPLLNQGFSEPDFCNPTLG